MFDQCHHFVKVTGLGGPVRQHLTKIDFRSHFSCDFDKTKTQYNHQDYGEPKYFFAWACGHRVREVGASAGRLELILDLGGQESRKIINIRAGGGERKR